MRIDVVTLFPDMVRGVGEYGVTGRAVRRGLLEIACWNPREFTSDVHRTVDDRPYGGGPGMVMLAGPLRRAIRAARSAVEGASRVVYLSPQGRPLTQERVDAFVASDERMILLAGRYEGIDERLLRDEVDEELSIGDYVLSGGELPAMVLIDAMARLLPGALGDARSAEQDSFRRGLLDCPHYTRPERDPDSGEAVPDVLLSGDHARIEAWRLEQSLGRTWERRPELLGRLRLDPRQQALLEAYIETHDGAARTRTSRPGTEEND